MKLESLSKPQLIEIIKKLKMSDDRFHSLVEHTSDSIFCYEYNPPISIDLPISKQVEMLYDGILVECNDIAAKSYGYTRASEVLGKPLLELFRATPGSLNDFFRSFIENGYRTINAEAHETLEDGSKRYFLNNGHAAIKNGYIERVWGTYREITELKKVEEALIKSEALYSSILKVAPVGIGMVVNKVFTWVSESFIEMVGYLEKDILGKSTRFIYPNDEEFEKVDQIKTEEIKKQGYGIIDTTFERKDGKVIDVDLRFIGLDPTNLSAGVIFTALDITERKDFSKQTTRK